MILSLILWRVKVLIFHNALFYQGRSSPGVLQLLSLYSEDICSYWRGKAVLEREFPECNRTLGGKQNNKKAKHQNTSKRTNKNTTGKLNEMKANPNINPTKWQNRGRSAFGKAASLYLYA